MKLWHKDTPRRRGAILPLVAISLVGLMGLMVLAIDAGSLQYQRRMAQTAADAGATAGAHEIYREQLEDSIFASVHAETTRNGFTNGANGVTVTPLHAPTTGPHAGDDNYVEVLISRPITTFFGSLLGRSTVTIDVRSVAGAVAPSDNCLYALEPTVEKALDVNSGSLLDVDCGIVVNSSNAKAVNVGSAGTLNGEDLAVTGNVYASGATVAITPGTQETGVAPSPDPLAYLQAPVFDPNHCDYGKPVTGNPVKVDTKGVITTLNPGIYCSDGDPAIEITGNGTAFLNPGLYILRGGGLKMGGGLIAGTGVTFFNTDPRPADADSTKFGKFEMGSASWAGGSVGAWLPAQERFAAVGSLSAPIAGATLGIPGILFFQDPDAGAPPTVYENQINSGSNGSFKGTFYFPTQPVKLGASGSTTTIDGGVVATMVSVESGSQVRLDMTTGLTGQVPIKRVALVE